MNEYLRKDNQNRKEVDLKMTTMDLIVMMSEGNPGALRVLAEIMQTKNGFLTILNLDDMNIRGTQIWIGYKDHCGQIMDRFMEAIHKREQGMVDCINKVGKQGNHEHLAVTGGASSPGKRGFLDEGKIVGKSW